MDPITAGILILIPNIFMFLFGIWVFSKNPGSKINRLYFGMVVSFIIWSGANFMLYVIPHEPDALNFWLNMAFVGPSLFLPFFLYFSYVFPDENHKISWPKFILIILPPVILIPASFAERVSREFVDLQGQIEWGWGFYVFYFFIFSFFTWFIYNFSLKLRYERKVSNRVAITYIFIGLFFAMISGMIFNFAIPVFWNSNEYIFLGPVFAGLSIAVFMSYAIVRYDLMDIKVIAKRALFYGVVVASATILLSVVVLVSRFMEEGHPILSIWLTPAVFSLLSVFLGLYIWRGMQASESMKYEFITVVTHKFRTPLTRVMWALDEMKDTETTERRRSELIRLAEGSAENILELINLLTTLSEESASVQKINNKVNMSEVLRKLLEEHRRVAEGKNLTLAEIIDDNVSVLGHKSRIRFIMNVLLENALMYTKNGGTVKVALMSDGEKVRFRVKDEGIGMDEKTKSLVFSTFFRGDMARLEDTEGMGVGLYIVRRIVDSMGGRVGFRSEGIGKGSLFFIELPVYKENLEES